MQPGMSGSFSYPDGVGTVLEYGGTTCAVADAPEPPPPVSVTVGGEPDDQPHRSRVSVTEFTTPAFHDASPAPIAFPT